MLLRTDIQGIPGHENVAIAVIVALVCGASTFGANAWQARHPLPVTYARLAPELVPLPVLPVKTVTVRLDQTATRWITMPWTCSEIRTYAKTHTEAEMKAKADEHRLTPEQREQAKACMKGKRP